MAYKQLVQPNLSITEEAGLCLQFARRVFGARAVEASAWQGWQRAKYRHQDRNWPLGVSVPVWFDWWGDLGAGRQRYGHAGVLHTDGKVYSSPLTGNGRAWFSSVDDLARAFGNGMTYVGWSEDISNVRVVEEDMSKQQLTRAEVNEIHILAFQGEWPGENVVNAWEGKELGEYLRWIHNGGSWKDRTASIKKLAADLAKALQKVPADTSDAEKKLQAIKDALGIK